MTEEKTYTKVCVECGFEFETKSKRIKLCDDCRKRKSAEKSKKQTEQFKKPKIKTKNKSKETVFLLALKDCFFFVKFQ